VSYWTDGKGDERIVYTTTGYRLVELNAKTGQPVASFGKNGVIDLKEGMIVGKDKQIDLEKGEVGWHATPLVVGDTIVVGCSMFEGLGYMYSTNTKGQVRAFDAKTGKLLWRFNTIPKPGEFGNNTWENGSWEWTGNVGVWTQITADPELGLVYLPVETPTIDEYGGNRPGDNLFAESLVAVDIKTGVRKWHYQLVHHPLWDFDISSAPLLIDATIDGRPRKLVAQPTKQGWLYTFDRVTGQPIWPMEERPVPQSDVPGEKTAKMQPFVTKPAPYSRTHVGKDDLIDFTPALRNQALQNLSRYRWEETPFMPPAYTGRGSKYLGSINIANASGGVNWPGSGFDPETSIFYTQAGNSAVTTAGFGDEELAIIGPEYQAAHRIPWWESPYGRSGRPGGDGGRGERGAAPPARGAAPAGDPQAAGAGGGRGGRGGGGGRGAAPAGGGAQAAAGGAAGAGGGGGGGRGGINAGLNGLSIVKPPYGVLTAIDMNTGNIKFKVPHGETPDNVRATLQQMGVTLTEKTGQGGSTGIMVTKTMVVAGDMQGTNPGGRPAGAMLRAYDKQTGKQIGEVLMPSRISGSPMTYMADGVQYITVEVGPAPPGAVGSQWVTYRLPATEIRPAGAQ